jgi:hypothetical protein
MATSKRSHFINDLFFMDIYWTQECLAVLGGLRYRRFGASAPTALPGSLHYRDVRGHWLVLGRLSGVPWNAWRIRV